MGHGGARLKKMGGNRRLLGRGDASDWPGAFHVAPQGDREDTD